MDASSFTSTKLASKFRGCMIGALMGDCLGYPFEFQKYIANSTLDEFLAKLMSTESRQILKYSDDSSMTISVASSLVENGELNAKDMAKRFADEYFRSPGRGYGGDVPRVFKVLRDTNYEDVFKPAKLQFNGQGSYGNGGAMRIAPIVLFGYSKGEQFIINAAEECSRITHTHPNGYNGAILQCLAINAVLGLDPSQPVDPVKFLNDLVEKMEEVERENTNKPFCGSLIKARDIFLQKQEYISSQEIAKIFGNDEIAVESVPNAIYAFLRSMKQLNKLENSNPFLRTLHFAITMGGDTDTIASMAGAIAGAFYGEDIIPDVLKKRCEAIDEVVKLGDELFKISEKKE